MSPRSLRFIAVSHGHHVQVWSTPSTLARSFLPFVRHRVYAGHHDDIISIRWSKSGAFFLTTSKDMTARLWSQDPVPGGEERWRSKTFAGHRDQVVGAYWSEDERTIYTVSRDGAVFVWRCKQDEEEEEDVMDGAGPSEPMAYMRWGIAERHYFDQAHAQVTCTTFHARTSLLVVGFSTGVFGLWEMPSFTNVHTLSISAEKIASVAINPSGEWLAFGASKLGQLLVWEWQSESYVLKQQGHYFDMNALAYAPDGQTVATAGEDGKVKAWNARTGFCFVTFSEHSASVSAVEFAKRGQVLFSASLDGTVRAFDLVRYRNFRTFTSPQPVQFSSLAVDPSGDVVCAGSQDSFEIYMWSVQTGKLLDVLSGHSAPIPALAFSPNGDRLASASWDRTVRIWSVFGRSRSSETLQLSSEVLALAFSPDGLSLAVSTLDGQISFFDLGSAELGKQIGVIEGRKDISGGRLADDRRTAKNNAASKHFNSLAYTADGSCLIAGGNSKYVCIYDCREGVMLRKFQISQNLSLDGTQELLDSRRLTEAGLPLDELDLRDEELEDRLDTSLPGAQRGDLSKRRTRRAARTTCVRFSPTGRDWAAASTEGLLLYGLDDSASFDPFDLDLDVTPENVLECINDGEHLAALVMAFRLNEPHLIVQAYEAVRDVRLITRQIPGVYLHALLTFIASRLEQGPHVEFDLAWITQLLTAHGPYLGQRRGEFASVLRALVRGVGDFEKNVSRLCDENAFSIEYVLGQQEKKMGDEQGEDGEVAMEV